MSNPARRRVFGGVAGFGLSTSALDMLFCALGAVMLLFSMQERVQIKAGAVDDNPIRSLLELRTSAAEDASAAIIGKRPSFQLLPDVSGEVVFLLDVSGSVGTPDQLATQRHIVAQFILQNRVDDFAVIAFDPNKAAPLVRFGLWASQNVESEFSSVIASRYETLIADGADAFNKNIIAAAIPYDEKQRLSDAHMLRKLAWLEIVFNDDAETISAAQIISDYDEPAGNARFFGAQSAIAGAVDEASGKTPTLVMVSDGGEFGRSASIFSTSSRPKVFPDLSRLDLRFPNRVSVSLATSATGLSKMQEFSSGKTGQHVVIYKFAVVNPYEEIDINDESSIKQDYRF